MKEGGMLGLTYNDVLSTTTEDDSHIDYLMKKYGLMESDKKFNIFIARQVVAIAEKIKDLGDFVETLPKVAGYLSRKDAGNIGRREIGHEVRTMAGSPDFLRRGSAYGDTNNIFLF